MTLSINTCNNAASGITANELILDLLATHEAHTLPVAVLCRAAAVFGMTEQNVRVALTRLVQQGKIANKARGVYTWNPAGSSLFRDVENWLHKDRRVVPWDGRWVGVVDVGVPRRNRTVWRWHERALALRGFQPLYDTLHLRPDNLGGGIELLRQELAELGLAPEAVVLGVHGLSAGDEQRARRLWDAAALQEGYRAMLEQLQRSEAKLDRMPLQEAAAETLLLGRSVIRRIIRDPLLPEELVPSAERRTLIERMRGYQERARGIWMRILEGA